MFICKKVNSNPHLAPYIKMNSKWSKPKCKTYNCKTTRKNQDKNICDYGLSQNFLYLMPKSQFIKENGKLDIKNFLIYSSKTLRE